ncbi:MAG: NAD-dependent epimerase/dehydratase family protein [Ilumatobacteraceae bacterium]
MTTALVTGGSGYFGALLATQLRAAGHHVRILDLNDPDALAFGEVDFVRGDIRDAAVVRTAVDGVDVVFHNVAQVPLAQDEHLLRTVNVDGTRILLDACVDAGVAKVVHTSSSAVFGVPESNPVLPTTVPKPAEAYGHAKLAAEWACLNAAANGLDVTIVRPRTILGHGRLGIFGILFDWIADGADVFVLGDGQNRYQFIHADDLADVCIRAGAASGPKIFNAGTDRFGTMRETLESVCAHAGTGAGVRSLPAGPASLAMRAAATAKLAPFAPYHWIMYSKSMWFDTAHVTEALGWTPKWSNNEMFAESYDWFTANRKTLDAHDDESTSHHRRPAKQGALSLLKKATRLLPG